MKFYWYIAILILLLIVHGCFCATMTGLSSCYRDYSLPNLKYYSLTLTEKVCHPMVYSIEYCDQCSKVLMFVDRLFKELFQTFLFQNLCYHCLKRKEIKSLERLTKLLSHSVSQENNPHFQIMLQYNKKDSYRLEEILLNYLLWLGKMNL